MERENMGVPVSDVEETVEAHCQVALKTAKGLDERPYFAYPRGKPWDEASGETGSGKKFYHDVISDVCFLNVASFDCWKKLKPSFAM